jgi:hypothetical protein
VTLTWQQVFSPPGKYWVISLKEIAVSLTPHKSSLIIHSVLIVFQIKCVVNTVLLNNTKQLGEHVISVTVAMKDSCCHWIQYTAMCLFIATCVLEGTEVMTWISVLWNSFSFGQPCSDYMLMSPLFTVKNKVLQQHWMSPCIENEFSMYASELFSSSNVTARGDYVV